MKKAQIKKSVSALAMAAVIAVSLLGYGCGTKSTSASTSAGVSGNFTATAKGFGGEDESPRFVHGVLGRIARQLEEDAKDPEAARRREEEALAAYAFPTNEEDSVAETAGEQPASEGAVENAPVAEGEDTSADAVSPEEPACAAEEPTCAPEEPVNVGL